MGKFWRGIKETFMKNKGILFSSNGGNYLGRYGGRDFLWEKKTFGKDLRDTLGKFSGEAFQRMVIKFRGK